MSWKYIALLLIGVILGGGAGYGVSLVYTPEILEGVLPDNYKSRLDGLIQQYQNLTDRYETAISEIEALQGSYDQLAGEYQDLAESHSSLSEDFAALSEDHEALWEAYNETLESYSSLLMQYQVITGSAPLTPQTTEDGTIRRDFAWIYAGKTYALTLYVPEQLYQYYVDKTRIPTEDYSVYVTHPHDDEYLSTIIDKFDEIALQEGYGEEQEVNLVIAFVQSLPYTPDEVSTSFDEYPRYPIETLVDGGGDCEDTSILASALLDSMDYGVVLISLPNHVAVGVAADAYGIYWLHEGTKYFYLETTGEGWELGELPGQFQGESAQVYPIIPVPVCTHDWSASILRQKLTLVANIRNVGTAEARGVKLYAAFDAGGGAVWNPVESAFFNLDPGEETTVMLELVVPRNVHTRLLVRILDPWGNVMDESHSEWFDTD
jgi:hypothetical protein